MPPANTHLDINVDVSVSKRFIKDADIRSTIKIFNEYLAKCVVPGRYWVIDESMNQWLGGERMPNLKKVPRKPHPIGQEEFKTLADRHSYCILQMDTVSDPLPKEFDNDPVMKKLTATVKRLVKPGIGTMDCMESCKSLLKEGTGRVAYP
ncbi:hypothetical protein MUCCIDRAFT_112951 [Mucor lusitanicus CBS 277.49]|uniref:PiggyBac transposable element-derived protein domain-containing protein n=1 Tax=Mucor lusitanicus CBS 277.49 TaxID=747725 RepID=A0A168JQT4_MUCCL|nr:hypothetical protein MUCCIDRAFT_112951 [Mucor lusitanicus CBS 277.49]